MGAKKNTGFRVAFVSSYFQSETLSFCSKEPPLFPQTERAKKTFRHLHKGNNKTFLNEKGYCTYGRIHQGRWWSDAREKGEDVKPDSGWPASAVCSMDGSSLSPRGIHFSQLLRTYCHFPGNITKGEGISFSSPLSRWDLLFPIFLRRKFSS